MLKLSPGPSSGSCLRTYVSQAKAPTRSPWQSQPFIQNRFALFLPDAVTIFSLKLTSSPTGKRCWLQPHGLSHSGRSMISTIRDKVVLSFRDLLTGFFRVWPGTVCVSGSSSGVDSSSTASASLNRFPWPSWRSLAAPNCLCL